MTGTVHSINVSPTDGVPKLPVLQAHLGTTVVDGDKQNNLYHGGPLRAACLYAIERIESLRAEGHPIVPGAIGENLTLAGLDWDAMVPGVRLRVGPAELEITQYTVPCGKIAKCFLRADIARVGQETRPGWSRVYTKVLREGLVRVGDAVRVVTGENHDGASPKGW